MTTFFLLLFMKGPYWRIEKPTSTVVRTRSTADISFDTLAPVFKARPMPKNCKSQNRPSYQLLTKTPARPRRECDSQFASFRRKTARILRVTVCEQRLATKRDHPAGRPGAQQPVDR